MGKNENGKRYSRKEFLKNAALGTAGLTFGMSAKSYANIIGANDRINIAIIGMHGRGNAHLDAINRAPNTQLRYLCDVDSRVLDKAIPKAKKLTGNDVKKRTDVRKLVEQNDIDAITIATPDHWHTAMALLGVSNGKHVYVEKPCSHNPEEGEMLVKAQKKYADLVIQMGNQQRSAPTSIQAVQDIRDGIIGRPYMGKAWYSNSRGPIGEAEQAPVPKWLDWELWQGPAPHEQYKPIWVHYNWHWFWHWGSGEINNNGTHEIDICRWALGVDYPTKVTSSGGRYAFNDSWQFYDTQVASYEFEGDKMITWEGRSCNPFPHHKRGRGSTIHGTKGTILLDRNVYQVYDMDNKKTKEVTEAQKSSTMNTVGGGGLTGYHMTNFVQAIRGKEKPHSPIDEGAKSNLLCHLGNYAQATNGSLQTDPKNGRILHNAKAMKYWSRDYEPGWKPKV